MPMTTEERRQVLGEELKRIVEVIVKQYLPEKIILFGSLVTGKIHPYSDIDLAIIKSTDKRFLDRLHEVHLMVRPQVGINFIIYTPKEFQEMIAQDRYFLTKEILEKGKVLYERQ